MSAAEVIEEVKRLTAEEQKQVFVFLTEKLLSPTGSDPKRWLGRKLSFEEACDVIFRENRELLSRLAQ